MKTSINLTLPPQIALDQQRLTVQILQKIKSATVESMKFVVRKRSIDARKVPVKVHLQLDVYLDEPVPEVADYRSRLSPVGD